MGRPQIHQDSYYSRHKDKCLKMVRLYRQTFPEKYKLSRKNYRKKQRKKNNENKEKIIALLGGKCSNPFNLEHGDFLMDKRCLTIDHVNDGGNRERKTQGSSYHIYILNKIKKGSKDYQLLCSNCNQIKEFIRRTIS